MIRREISFCKIANTGGVFNLENEPRNKCQKL